MEAYGGGFLVDEKAVQVENIFLEFLKRSARDFFLVFLINQSTNLDWLQKKLGI